MPRRQHDEEEAGQLGDARHRGGDRRGRHVHHSHGDEGHDVGDQGRCDSDFLPIKSLRGKDVKSCVFQMFRLVPVGATPGKRVLATFHA